MIKLLICVIALAAKVASEGCHFGYEGDSCSHWGDEFNDCKGKHQSPIDIDSEHVTPVSLPPLKFNGFDIQLDASLTNNGHTAMLTLNSDFQPTITGGPLDGSYVFAQLHFHWGINDTCGSEDQFNDKKYPLEMHLVYYKEDYADVNTAMGHSDGLCVLGCLFELQKHDNNEYNSLVKTLAKVIKPNSVEKFCDPPALFDLIPSDLSSYFTYNGSLTTPPCSEAVIWIDFEHSVKISHDQLQAFRSLTDSEGDTLVNNFRAVQPLGDRVVYYCKADIDDGSLLQKMKNSISKIIGKFSDLFDSLLALL